MKPNLNLPKLSLSQTSPNRFSIPVELPSGKNIRLHELHNSDYLILTKYCENDDFRGFINSIEVLIDQFTDLNLVDKAYALILYRSIFISSEIQVANKDGHTITASLQTILDNIAKIVVEKVTFNVDGFFIELDPLKTYVHLDNSMHSCIRSIKLNDKVIRGEDVEKSMEFLPHNVFARINNKIINMYDRLQGVVIIEENDSIKLAALRLNLSDETFGKFIMTIFKTDLTAFFESIFVYSQHLQGIDYLQLAPLDSKVLETILHREITAAKKAQDKSPTYHNPLTPSL
jgi:hypothetical protein